MTEKKERERENLTSLIARDGNVFIHRFTKQRGSNRCVMNKAVHVPQFFVLPIAKGDVVLKKKTKQKNKREREKEGMRKGEKIKTM